VTATMRALSSLRRIEDEARYRGLSVGRVVHGPEA
jgi:hypothetical protein